MTARFQPPPSPSNLFSNFPATQSILHIAARGILWKWKLDHVLPLLKSLQMPSVAGVCRCDLHFSTLMSCLLAFVSLADRMEFLGASPLTGRPPVSERWHLLLPLPGALSDHTIKWQTLEPLLKHQTSLTKTKSQPMEWLSNINKLQIYMIFENNVHDKRLISRINKEFLKLKN